jgi:SAM-dependent methyltransferase
VTARQVREGSRCSLRQLGRVGDRGALAHYADPAYYTKTYAARRHDVEYYVALARCSGGPVLEYGIGNGRIAIPMARAGIEVVGVDLSRPMLRSLTDRLRTASRRVRERLTFVHGDMRSVRLGRRFALVLATFNTILHLYELADVEQFLSRVREHLAPGARFVFDFSVPSAVDLARTPDKSYGSPRLRDPSTGKLVRYAERFEYDSLRQILLIRMEFNPVDGSRSWTVPLTHRQFFPQEMHALLLHNGFDDIVWSADFTDQLPGPDVDSLVVSCRVGGGHLHPARRCPRPGRTVAPGRTRT